MHFGKVTPCTANNVKRRFLPLLSHRTFSSAASIIFDISARLFLNIRARQERPVAGLPISRSRHSHPRQLKTAAAKSATMPSLPVSPASRRQRNIPLLPVRSAHGFHGREFFRFGNERIAVFCLTNSGRGKAARLTMPSRSAIARKR